MRDISISMTKGLAILLMVLVHARFSHYGDTYINMFHMPLFFFMSGYCFKESYLKNAKVFLWKRIKGAYWPFVKWGLLFLLLHNVFYSVNIYNGEYGFRGAVSKIYTTDDFLQHATTIVISMSGPEQLLGGYWFLHSYFVAAILSFATIWICRGMVRLSIGGGLLLIVCTLLCKYHIGISRFISVTDLLATFFMVMGFVYNKSQLRLEDRSWLLIPLYVIIVAIGAKFWPCAMLKLQWWKIIPYSFTALTGTIMVFSICRRIDLNKVGCVAQALSYIGDKTLEILTWHFLGFKACSLIIIIFYSLPIARLSEFPVIEEYAYKGWWLPYFIIGTCMSLSIAFALKYAKELFTYKTYIQK